LPQQVNEQFFALDVTAGKHDVKGVLFSRLWFGNKVEWVISIHLRLKTRAVSLTLID
jgi:hypothetical protein